MLLHDVLLRSKSFRQTGSNMHSILSGQDATPCIVGAVCSHATLAELSISLWQRSISNHLLYRDEAIADISMEPVRLKAFRAYISGRLIPMLGSLLQGHSACCVRSSSTDGARRSILPGKHALHVRVPSAARVLIATERCCNVALESRLIAFISCCFRSLLRR